MIVLWAACAWAGQRWGLFGLFGLFALRALRGWELSQGDGQGGKLKHHSLAVPNL